MKKTNLKRMFGMVVGALALASLVLLSDGTHYTHRAAGLDGGPHPNVTFDGMPESVSPGHDFTFTLLFDNTGTGPGYNPYIEL